MIPTPVFWPGEYHGLGIISLLQGIFPTQGSNQYSGLENSMDYIVHGLAKSQTD